MIFSSKKQFKIIATKVLPGYANFTTEHFSRDFKGGETLVVYYPPDHPQAGTKYNYTVLEESDPDAASLEVMGLFSSENPRVRTTTEDFLDEYKSYHLDFYVIPFPVKDQDIHPLTNANGYDSFLIKGSIIEGRESGARRFYDGPFKGFTVESQDGCIEVANEVSLNELDGSSCEGYLKGSYYETGYDIDRHNLRRYRGVTRHLLDPRDPRNTTFMQGTPFGSLDMSWLSVHDREKRPIPYRMNTGGHAAVLITQRHAIIPATAGYAHDYQFYSPSQGIVKANVTKSTATAGPYSSDTLTRDFKNMWKVLGFKEPDGNQELTNTYNSLMNSFKDCTIVTFDQDLPSDVVPVTLVDRNGSDVIRWAMTIGQEGRGHLLYFCGNTKTDVNWRSSYCPKCEGDEDVYLPPECSIDDMPRTFSNGDESSPLFTYYRSDSVFLGFLNEIGKNLLGSLDYVRGENAVMVRESPPNYECLTHNPIEYARSGQLITGTYNSAWDIGNSTKYPLPWGYEISAQDLLTSWIRLDGDYDIETATFQAETTDTSSTYPYPIVIDEDGEVIEPGEEAKPRPVKYRLAPWNRARAYRED